MQDNYCPLVVFTLESQVSRLAASHPRRASRPHRSSVGGKEIEIVPRSATTRSFLRPIGIVPPFPRLGQLKLRRGQTCDRYAFIICKGGNNNIVVSRDTSPRSARPPSPAEETTLAWANNACRGINRGFVRGEVRKFMKFARRKRRKSRDSSREVGGDERRKEGLL